MMRYYFEPNIINKIIFLINKISPKKNKIFSQFINFEKGKNYLIETKEFVSMQGISRDYIYKSVNNIKKFDIHTKNYIRKNYELGDFLNRKENISFFDFIIFLKKNNLGVSNRNLKKVNSYYKNLILKNKTSTYFILLPIYFISYLLFFFKFLIYFIKALILCLVSKKNIDNQPNILFLRKKNYPDQNHNRMLKLFNNDKKKYNGINILFKNVRKNDELENLNNIKLSTIITIIAFIKTILTSLKISHIFLFNFIHPRIFYFYVRDTFISFFLSSLNSKIFFGILVDKPFFILLDRNKKKYQFTFSLNESFFYKPLRTFDYVHLDKYYSMNNIDKMMLNEYAGSIREYYNVPFFRKNILNSFSKGISNDLKNKLSKFKKTILLTPIQYDRKRFWAWNEIDYKNFHQSVINLANIHTNFLFIYKEKKGELEVFSKEEIQNLNKIPNLFIVRSKKPRFLEFNQFEDLLKISDCLISQSHTSTTIWQAINEMKYVIAINNSFESSFLKDFEIETNLESLNDHFQKFISMNNEMIIEKLNTIREYVNINKIDGLEEVYKDLIRNNV